MNNSAFIAGAPHGLPYATCHGASCETAAYWSKEVVKGQRDRKQHRRYIGVLIRGGLRSRMEGEMLLDDSVTARWEKLHPVLHSKAIHATILLLFIYFMICVAL